MHKLSFKNKIRMESEKKHHITATVWILGIAIWPLIWTMTMRDVACSRGAMAGFAWPITALLLNLHSLVKYTNEPESKRMILQMDANAVCSMVFALSGVFGATQDKPEKHIFNTAIFFCLAFVMPSFQVPHNSLENTILEAFQAVMIAYSTGLLLTGSLHLAVDCK